MNLQDLIKKQTTVTHHKDVVQYKGEDIDFYTRPLLASDQERLLEQIGDILPAVQKIQEAQKKDDITASISGKDLVMLQTARRHYASCVLCDAQGKKLFNSYAKMVQVMDSEPLDLIADYIDENVKDEQETSEEIEKN